MLAAYTYGKSIDQSSELGRSRESFDPALSRAVSPSMCAKLRGQLYLAASARTFVRASESLDQRLGVLRHYTFHQRFPVTLINYGDNSLLGAEPNGSITMDG